jgi:hypothetical protein
MKEWLEKVENALSKALESVDSSDEIPRENNVYARSYYLFSGP